MKTRRAILLFSIILLSLSTYANDYSEYSVKWILDDIRFVKTKPNAIIYQVGTRDEEEYDARFAELQQDYKFRYLKRKAIDYTSHKIKKIRKPKDFKVRGFANKNKQFHYDTYVVEIKKCLYYLPIEFVEDNKIINAENTVLDNEYNSLLKQMQDYAKERDSLRMHYLPICEEKYEYYNALLSQLPIKIDSVKNKIRENYNQYQDSILEEWYNKLSTSAKNTYDNKIDITYTRLSLPNSAGGCDYNIGYINKSPKTIKYFKWTGDFYNAVDDRVYCEIRGYSRFTGTETGPIKSGVTGGGRWECVIYNWTANYVKIDNIQITYTDGSSTSINAKDIEALLNKPDALSITREKFGYEFVAIDNAIKPYEEQLRKVQSECENFRRRIYWLKQPPISSSGYEENYYTPKSNEYGDEEYKKLFTRLYDIHKWREYYREDIKEFEKKNFIQTDVIP